MSCRGAGGTPNLSGVEVPVAGQTGEGYPPYLTQADLNGDGQPDYVMDLAGLECVNAWSYFCGSAGCPVTVWLSGVAGHAVAWGGHAQAWELRGPEVVVMLHGQMCTPPRVGAEGCEVAMRFDDNASSRPGAAGDPVAAPAAAAPPAPPVWQVRVLSPDRAPFVDGRIVAAFDPDGDLGFNYVCSRAGDSRITLDRGVPAALAAQAPVVQVRFEPDRGLAFEFAMTAGPGPLSVEIDRTGIFLSALRGAGEVTVRVGGRPIGRVPFSGFSDMVDLADRYCFGN